MNIVSPSLLACNFTSIKEELIAVDNAQWLHFDVMDGVFVNNISIGFPVLQALRNSTDKFLDVHLMICDPLEFIDTASSCGADLISFHVENYNLIFDRNIKVIEKIRANSKKVGMAVLPDTPINAIFPYLEFIDMVTIMTVQAGFGGQSFRLDCADKIKPLHEEITRCGLDVHIQVDGGINIDTAKICFDLGADVFVAGTSIFKADNPAAVIDSLLHLS